MVTCLIDNKKFKSKQELYFHLRKHYSLNLKTYTIQYIHGGKIPSCKCGCEKEVKWNLMDTCFREYKQGHISRVKNNWGHNPKAINASSKTRRKQYKNGERKVWNDGLTIDDTRVKNNGKSVSKSFTKERREKYSKQMSHNRKNKIVLSPSGKNHPNWKGGVSSLQSMARSDNRLYREWKLPILEKFNFTCTECSKTGNLHVHHDKESFADIIKKVMTIEDYEQLDDFEVRKRVVDKITQYHIDNQISGVPLCQDCHSKLHPSLNFVED